MFIGSHCFLCLYGAIAGIVIFSNIIVRDRLEEKANFLYESGKLDSGPKWAIF